MRKKVLILSLLPLTVLAGPADEHCGQFPPEPGAHHARQGFGDRLPPFLDKIDLNATQKTAIKRLLDSRKAEFEAGFDQNKTARQALHKLSFSNEYSDEKARELIEKTADAHKAAALQKAGLDNAIYKLLTSEQQQKLQTEIADFPPR